MNESMTPSDRPSRRLAFALTAVAAVGLALLLWLLIPWGWGDRLPDIPASRVFSVVQLREAETVSGGMRHLGWASLGLTVVVSVLLGVTRAGRALVGLARGPWWVRCLLLTLAVMVVNAAVALPFGWAQRRIALRHGLTHQSASGWWRDQATSLGVGFVTTALVVLVVVGLARLAPRLWPALAAAVVAVLVVAGSWAWPVLVEPLFNNFSSMPASPLRTEIDELAAREGVHLDDVLVADASRRTTTLNAYVSGFGDTRRLVVYDTLLSQVPADQVRSVIGHELGHARENDVVVGTGLAALGGVLGVGLLGLLMGWAPLRRPLRARSMGDPVVVPLLLALLTVGQLLAAPVENAASRAVEARADHDALVATKDPQALIDLQRSLALASLADPTPPEWSQWWFGSHPTTLQRIGAAVRWAEQHHRAVELGAH